MNWAKFDKFTADLRKDAIESGLLESWVNLHRHTTPENRSIIKKLITALGLNNEANEIVRKAHKKTTT